MLRIHANDYSIIKARGIAFLDQQKVKIKGSEVGYSLQTIEKLLTISPTHRIDRVYQKRQRDKLDTLLAVNVKLLSPGKCRRSTSFCPQKESKSIGANSCRAANRLSEKNDF